MTAYAFFYRYPRSLAFGRGLHSQTATVKAQLVATTGGTPYTPARGHYQLADVPSGARVAAPVTLTLVTNLDGILDAADVEFMSVPNGAAVDGIVFYDFQNGAAGTITAIAGSLLVDNTDTFTLDDGTNPAVTFEFDNNASVVNGATLWGVPFTGTDTFAVVARSIADAINARNAYNSAFTIKAEVRSLVGTPGVADTVQLLNTVAGAGNTTSSETVADAGFAISNMTGDSTGENSLLWAFTNQAGVTLPFVGTGANQPVQWNASGIAKIMDSPGLEP